MSVGLESAIRGNEFSKIRIALLSLTLAEYNQLSPLHGARCSPWAPL